VSLGRLIEFPVIPDERGKLCVIEGLQAPFPIARMFYLYDVPSGAVRAGHAHKDLQQVILALSGSFDARLKDGRTEEVVTLNRPNVGLHVGPGVWRELENFTSGAVCVVLASSPYNEGEYIREYDDFLRHVGAA